MKVLLLRLLPVVVVILHISSFVSSYVSFSEISALEDLFTATGGYESLWSWKQQAYFGGIWNFSRNAAGDTYLHNPCSNMTWQGIDCSSSPIDCSDVNQSCSITKLNLFNYNLVGTLPNSLYLLNNLQEMVFWNNRLSGTLPHTLSLLTKLQILDFYDNILSGGIIPVLPLTGLTELYLSYNLFSGVLPTELEQFTQLKMLYLNDNFFSGSLITELGMLHSVEFLDLNFNGFTGPLIEELGELSSLQRLYLNNNLLTGPLHSSLGRLTQLERLDIFYCQLTGSLIPEIGHMVQMSKLDLGGNQLTGHILPSLGDMLMLETLSLFGNKLTGFIPLELRGLTRLKRLSLENNQLEGPLPSFFGNFTDLSVLSLGNNAFTGPLMSVSALTLLKRLLLPNNRLTGEVAEGRFNRNMSLEVLDLSHNRLCGVIPDEIFDLPHIVTIALSLNCFHGTLPLAMCGAKELLVLAMDGLGVAKECQTGLRIPFSGALLWNTLEGSIPACLWSLPHIELLHLSGNGLTGTISSEIPNNSTLKDLSLAHNKISGTLPASLAALHFTELDLSFNRITGKYKQMNVTDSAVTLEVNRLSGPLPAAPAAFALVRELVILRDNLFGCSYVPSEDTYSEDFSCGSQFLDIALYVFAGVVSPLLFWLFMLLLSSKIKNVCFLKKSNDLLARQLSRLRMFDSQVFPSLHAPELLKIYTFQRSLRSIGLKFIVIFAWVCVVSCPIYILKALEYGRDDGVSYSTHTYTYSWLLSMAYITGNIPASLLLFGWISVFGLCYFLFSQGTTEVAFPILFQRRRGSSRGASCHDFDSRWSGDTEDSALCGSGSGGGGCSRELQGEEDSPETTPMYLHCLCFAGNLCVVTCVNILYVISTFQPMTSVEHLAIQICVAAFKVVYNNIVLHKLTTWLTVTQESNIKMQLILSIINKILIPCVITAFASPSCFQNLLVEPDDIVSAYTYDFCGVVSLNADGSTGSCLQYTVNEVDVIPMTPPIIYNHLCSSVLLATYIPVYIFMFSFQILGTMLILLLFNDVDYSSVWAPCRRVTHGLLWPEHWSKCGMHGDVSHPAHQTTTTTSTTVGDDSTMRSASRKLLFKSVPFQLCIMNHLMLLMTFGFCSLFLGLVLVTSLLTEIGVTMLIVSRFVEQRLGSTDLAEVKEVDDHALVVLSQVKFHMLKVFKYCLWPLMTSSALFFAVITWDMTSDASDWIKGCWAPVISIGALVGARVGQMVCKTTCDGQRLQKHSDRVAMLALQDIHKSSTNA